jgi:hypothetical protein
MSQRPNSLSDIEGEFEESTDDGFVMPHHVSFESNPNFPKWDHEGVRILSPHKTNMHFIFGVLEIDRDKFIKFLQEQKPIVRFDLKSAGMKRYMVRNTYKMIK